MLSVAIGMAACDGFATCLNIVASSIYAKKTDFILVAVVGDRR